MKSIFEALLSTVDKTIKTGSTLTVPDGDIWLILHGAINHVTGTTSNFRHFRDSAKANSDCIHIVGMSSGSSSGLFNFFYGSNSVSASMPASYWIAKGGDVLSFTGGTNSSVTFRIAKLSGKNK